ncbi:pseudouridine synthase [Suicoccus acidiformans]|uniref:Pseudouridine synthase n=1 Tax=Suicoccus acidiformans TaxID=2036206 RepID=A0A347WL62_9LACT|nr:RluA family pseudouridine synthase [Suicoccus acidiformans]AXY25819.1 pseudouridine synthase [Suicoccus acidiformans]
MADVLTLQLNGQTGRLDKVLAEEIADLSRASIQRLLQEGHILVNGQVEKAKFKLKGDELIEVIIVAEEPLEVVAEAIPLDIIYEDEDVLVINKPKGMVVHPSKGHPQGTLANGLVHYLDQHQTEFASSIRPGIVHRLDKDTTGLLVVAKNRQSHQFLSEQLLDRQMGRTYTALVLGQVQEQAGIIDAPLARDPHQRLRWIVDVKGKEALTQFQVLERFQEVTLLEVELKTGRTHQIRVHMEYIGHPLVGDAVYRRGATNYGGQLASIQTGQYLHASELHFIHPTRQEWMSFEAPLPSNYLDLLNTLKA